MIMGVIRDMQVTPPVVTSEPEPEITAAVIKAGKCPFCHDSIRTGEDHQHFGREVTDRLAGRYQGRTAADWREAAETYREAGRPLSARECELSAQLAEVDGIWEFPGLFTLTGALVPESAFVKIRTTGRMVWRIGTGDLAQWFTPSQALSGARRRANDASKGYALGVIRRRAYVATSGLGCCIREVASSPVEIIDDGKLGTQYQDR